MSALIYMRGAHRRRVASDAPLRDVQKDSRVLTPGRYVGAAEEDDGEPFEEKIKRLTVTLREQQAKAARLDGAISANLKELGYGG
jgi:type I restriction enzyme M protein